VTSSRVVCAGLGSCIALAASLTVAGCEQAAAPRPVAAAAGEHAGEPAREHQWQDAFAAPPEVLVVLYPAALREDAVYGPLLRRAILLARQQSRVVARTRALEAMEDAEEVIVGWRSGSAEADDLVVVVRGVRADVDPGAIVDSDGHPLWTPGPPGEIRELVRAPDPSGDGDIPASLFELPGRTWVIAAGDARARVRSAYLRGPRARTPSVPEPKPEDALLTVRIDGAALVRRIPALRPGGDRPHALAAVGRDLIDVSLQMNGPAGDDVPPPRLDVEADGGAPPPPTRVLKALLSYGRTDSASTAEATARDVLDALARRKDDLAWLPSGPISLSRPAGGTQLVLTAALPPRLIDALIHVGVRADVAEAHPSPSLSPSSGPPSSASSWPAPTAEPQKPHEQGVRGP
jgi:hypothetical protein